MKNPTFLEFINLFFNSSIIHHNQLTRFISSFCESLIHFSPSLYLCYLICKYYNCVLLTIFVLHINFNSNNCFNYNSHVNWNSNKENFDILLGVEFNSAFHVIEAYMYIFIIYSLDKYKDKQVHFEHIIIQKTFK